MLGLGYAKLFWRHLLIFKAPHRQWDGYHLQRYPLPEFCINVRAGNGDFGQLLGCMSKLRGYPQLPHYLQDSLASVRGGVQTLPIRLWVVLAGSQGMPASMGFSAGSGAIVFMALEVTGSDVVTPTGDFFIAYLLVRFPALGTG